jgi:hypothetical protein
MKIRAMAFRRSQAISGLAIGLLVLVLLIAAVGGYYLFTRAGSGNSVSLCSNAFVIHAQDSVTGVPIAGAAVTYGGTSVVADSAGNADFTDNGAQTLTVSASGYNVATQSGFVPAIGYAYSFALVKAPGTATVTITTSATSTDIVTCTTTTTSPSSTSTSTSSTSTSSSSTSSSSTSSETTTETTNTSMLETFHAHYTWSHTTNSSGTVETFSASGTFTITIDLNQGGGIGKGQGTVDDTVTGICTGHSSTGYTFDVTGGINTLNGNLTLGFGLANPGTGTTTVTCQNSGTNDNTFGFSPVVPPVVTLPGVYGASVQGTIDGGPYEITLA